MENLCLSVSLTSRGLWVWDFSRIAGAFVGSRCIHVGSGCETTSLLRRLQVCKASSCSCVNAASRTHQWGVQLHEPQQHSHVSMWGHKTDTYSRCVPSEMQQKQTEQHQQSISLQLYGLVLLCAETDDDISDLRCIVTLLHRIRCVFSVISCVSGSFLGVCFCLPT